jgi:hypothetical protein
VNGLCYIFSRTGDKEDIYMGINNGKKEFKIYLIWWKKKKYQWLEIKLNSIAGILLVLRNNKAEILMCVNISILKIEIFSWVIVSLSCHCKQERILVETQLFMWIN